MWKTCNTDWNLSRHLIPFMQDNAFYAEISRHIQKRITVDIPTAAVSFDPKADELVMWVNPFFMGGGTYKSAPTPPRVIMKKDGTVLETEAKPGEDITCEPLSNWEIRGVIRHEYDHLVYGHLNARRRKPHDKCNIAQDLAINSIITTHGGRPRDVDKDDVVRALPKIALIPGVRPYVDPKEVAKMSPERKAAVEKFSDLIEKMPPMKSSEWYFNKLMEESQKNGGEGDGDVELVFGPMDSHDGWDELPEDLREYVEGKVKAIIEKAVRKADSMSNGWGDIPSELREEIRRSVSNIINWRNVLRQFVGQLVRGHRTSSIKRINRRYPYIHPGTKRGYVAKLLVAIDESGSVSDEMLEMFFAELEQLTKKVDITILHFDCYCDMKDLYEWKKGMRPKLHRVKGGGTNFDAPTKLANDPKNRGRWDGMLIATDGCAPAPGHSRIKRGWVLGQGCTLNFPTTELTINLTKERPMSGAWR